MKYLPFENGHFFHLYNRGNNTENIFKKPENYTYFLKLLKKYLIPIAEVYSYCLLSNHFHLLIRFKEPYEMESTISNKPLHQPISNMLNAYTKAINKRYERRGSLFQEHLKRVKIENEEYLKNLIIYINTNSSHHQIADYETYDYSSYKALVSDNVTLLKRQEVIELFDTVENFNYVLRHKKFEMEAMQDIVLE